MKKHPMPRFDVVDREGRPLGFTASIRQVYRQGLWHKSVQVVVFTRDGAVLVQQRAAGSIILPSYLDISAAGGVDPGETPLQAAGRETAEELGIRAPLAQFRPLPMRRYSHRWPGLGVHSRALVYPFLLELDRQAHLHLQSSEVSAARFVPLAEARRLVGHHRLRWGRLIPRYAFYGELLHEAEREIA